MNDDGMDVDEEVEYNFCVKCYLSELSVVEKRVNNGISKKEMIKKLSTIAKCELQQSDPLLDVMDIYESLVNEKGNNLYEEEIMELVKFPRKNAKYMKQQNIIAPFDFKDGAQFITDDRLNMNQRIQILELFSQLINFQLLD